MTLPGACGLVADLNPATSAGRSRRIIWRYPHERCLPACQTFRSDPVGGRDPDAGWLFFQQQFTAALIAKLAAIGYAATQLAFEPEFLPQLTVEFAPFFQFLPFQFPVEPLLLEFPSLELTIVRFAGSERTSYQHAEQCPGNARNSRGQPLKPQRSDSRPDSARGSARWRKHARQSG